MKIFCIAEDSHTLLEKFENLLHYSHNLPTKNNSVFDYAVGMYLTSLKTSLG